MVSRVFNKFIQFRLQNNNEHGIDFIYSCLLWPHYYEGIIETPSGHSMMKQTRDTIKWNLPLSLIHIFFVSVSKNWRLGIELGVLFRKKQRNHFSLFGILSAYLVFKKTIFIYKYIFFKIVYFVKHIEIFSSKTSGYHLKRISCSLISLFPNFA